MDLALYEYGRSLEREKPRETGLLSLGLLLPQPDIKVGPQYIFARTPLNGRDRMRKLRQKNSVAYKKISSATLPETSVNRKSRPAW